MTIQMKALQDTVRHPFDSTSLLNWALGQWDIEPKMPLIILTQAGDGQSLDNRLRVKLSKIRRVIRRAGVADMREFGIRSQVIQWTDDQGQRYDALCLERFVSSSQNFAMIFNKLDINHG